MATSPRGKLDCPGHLGGQKKDVLKTSGGEGALDAITTNFLGLLVDKQRIKNLDDICD